MSEGETNETRIHVLPYAPVPGPHWLVSRVDSIATTILVLGCLSVLGLNATRLWYYDESYLLFGCLALLSFGACVVLSLVGIWRARAGWHWHLIRGVLALLIPIGEDFVLSKYVPIVETCWQADMNAAILGLARDVERVRIETGQLPKDWMELERILGRPSPRTGWGTRVRYQPDPNDRTHYRIRCPSGDYCRLYIYDPRNPTAGIVWEAY